MKNSKSHWERFDRKFIRNLQIHSMQTNKIALLFLVEIDAGTKLRSAMQWAKNSVKIA